MVSNEQKPRRRRAGRPYIRRPLSFRRRRPMAVLARRRGEPPRDSLAMGPPAARPREGRGTTCTSTPHHHRVHGLLAASCGSRVKAVTPADFIHTQSPHGRASRSVPEAPTDACGPVSRYMKPGHRNGDSNAPILNSFEESRSPLNVQPCTKLITLRTTIGEMGETSDRKQTS